ncbi:MAG: MFS transporter [Patescibacteria group bacterium]
MPVHGRHPLHRRNPAHIGFWLIYVISVIFTFHTLLTAYNNSTYMEQFVNPAVIGALYSIGSALAVFSFLFISRVLRKVGNVRLTLWLAIIELLSLVALGLATDPRTAIIAFVVFLTLNPLLYLSIDIFSESLIGDNEDSTGSKRGLTLGLMSMAAVIAPLTMGYLVGDDSSNLPNTYFASAAVMTLFVLIIIARFDSFKDPEYKEIKVLQAIQSFWDNTDVRGVFLAHFLLQFFFAWMVIYFPLYLATEIMLPWDEIGAIIAVGLFAYVLFEYPIGIVADRWTGEKEMMAIGFVILAVASASISYMGAATVAGWMALMFVSRIGASLVEATTESYFFKHVDGSDANVMSFFRLTRPLANLIGALAGTITLLYLPFNLIFVILGLLMIPGIFITLTIKDTK